MKNIERIKQMSNNELAEFLNKIGKNCEICAYNYDWGDCLGNVCVHGTRHWLESECECGGRTTNIEKIKTMNSEELAIFFDETGVGCHVCVCSESDNCEQHGGCVEGYKKWLESEAEE